MGKQIRKPRNGMTGMEGAATRALERSTTDGDGCQIFGGATGVKGYGQIRTTNPEYPVGDPRRYRTTEAHRAVWMNEHGEVPENMHIRHACGKKLCMNVEHMFLWEYRQVA